MIIKNTLGKQSLRGLARVLYSLENFQFFRLFLHKISNNSPKIQFSSVNKIVSRFSIKNK